MLQILTFDGPPIQSKHRLRGTTALVEFAISQDLANQLPLELTARVNHDKRKARRRAILAAACLSCLVGLSVLALLVIAKT